MRWVLPTEGPPCSKIVKRSRLIKSKFNLVRIIAQYSIYPRKVKVQFLSGHYGRTHTFAISLHSNFSTYPPATNLAVLRCAPKLIARMIRVTPMPELSHTRVQNVFSSIYTLLQVDVLIKE